MPCARSVFSDSRLRNCSFRSERQIAMPEAFIVARCGTFSNISSKPSAAGAFTVSAAAPVSARVTAPSSRNSRSGARWPASYSTRPDSRLTWRPVPAMRNSSSTDVNWNTGSFRNRSAISTAGSGSSQRAARCSGVMFFAASAHDAASKTYQSLTSRCSSAYSRSSASVQSPRCSTSCTAAAATTWSSSWINCARLSSASRMRVFSRALPRLTFSSIGSSSTSGITRFRIVESSRLSRYSAALALVRESPCASDQRAAAMSFHG